MELKPFTLQDVEAYLPLVSEPAVIRYTGEVPMRTVDEVRGLLASHPLHDYAIHGYGRMACVEKNTGRLVGFCGLKYLEDLQETDIGYCFVPDCWGKGYATESAQSIMDYGKRTLGLGRIVGLVEPENTGSISVLEKLGLAFESTVVLADHIGPLWLYATSPAPAALPD